jgi:hypothetical protein
VAKKAKKRGYFATLLRARMWQGAVSGSRLWTVVAAVTLGRALLKRLGGDEEEIVYSEELPPGQALVITAARDPR